MTGYLLLTGGTGLLGRYLIGDLLARGTRLALLVRDTKQQSAAERIEAILQLWESRTGQRSARPVLLRGDIRRDLLGLSSSDVKWVSRHCTALMHSAASLKFHADGSGEPWLSNIEGTRNMLGLCEAAKLRKLHYVSTAYVCGLREGTIYESELNCGQAFRNEYEQSKLQAEELVRSADHLDQLTVYRPAVISGDSQTGYTNTYHGIYLYLRIMALLVPRQPFGPDGLRQTHLRLPMRGDERRNVIPVDWVSKVMAHLACNPKSYGHTFHLVPDQCLSPRQVINAGYRYFQSTGVEYVGYQSIDPATYNAFEAELLPSLAMYNNYASTDPAFDSTNLKRFAGELPCPELDESILHTYIRFGEQDRWGKRRPAAAKTHVSSAEYFRKFKSGEGHGNVASRIALDLTGPGGGQWTLGLLTDGTVVCEQGLDARAESVLRSDIGEFRPLIEEQPACIHQHAVAQFFSVSAHNAKSPGLPHGMVRH